MKIFKRRQDFLAQFFQRVCESGIFRNLQRLAPFFSAPAELQRGIFETINFVFGTMAKPGFERGEKIVVLPVECDRAQRAMREFGERVVGDTFAAVEKKRNLVTAKNAGERFVIIVEIANDDAAIAKTVFAISGADEFQNFARGENGFGFGIGAGNGAGGVLGFEFWVLSCL